MELCIFNDLCRFVYSIYLMSLSLACYDDGCIIFVSFVDASLRHIFLLCTCVTASYFSPVLMRHCVIFFSRVHVSLRHIFLMCSCVTASYFSPLFMRHCVIFFSCAHASLRQHCQRISYPPLVVLLLSIPSFRTFTLGSFSVFVLSP